MMKKICGYLLLLCIPVYGVFLSLPFVTEVGYEYLPQTAKKAQAEMERLADGLETFRVKYNRYPNPSASHWINDASLTAGGEDILLITSGVFSDTIYDPFIADAYTQPYRYYSDGETWFVIACNGPDQDEDVTPAVLQQFSQPSHEDLRNWIYNPSNGYRSGGDVIVVSGSGQEEQG